jgi:hypothetical protein
MILFKVLGMLSMVTISTLDPDTLRPRQEGDIHNWKTIQWSYDKSCSKYITDLNILQSLVPMGPKKLNVQAAYQTCSRFGNGTIGDFQNITKRKEIYDFYKEMNIQLNYIHFPYSQVRGRVANFHTDETISDLSCEDKCQYKLLSTFLFAFNGTSCIKYCSGSNNEFHFFCNLTTIKFYKLHGFINTFVGDQLYYPSFGRKEFFWLGLNGTLIVYNQTAWFGKTYDSSMLISSNATFNSLLFGTSNWTFSNMKSLDEKPTSLTLSMHTCKVEEFVCDDGSCILYEGRCDGIFTCPDNSDEKDCYYIRFPVGYNKEQIVPSWTKTRVDMDVQIHLLDVLNVNINMGRMDVKLNVTMKWYDFRLNYVFLNKDPQLNVLDSQEFNSVWKPELIYTNRDVNPYFINIAPEVSVGLKQTGYRVKIHPVLGTVTREYEGYENPLYWSSVIR